MKKQTNHLLILKKFYHRFRRLPSYQEMLSLFNVSSKNSAFYIINKIVKDGQLTKSADGRLVPTSHFFSLPLLGSIKAGSPTSEESQEQEYVTFDMYGVENPQDTYLLKVSGDSMIDEGIRPGDMVVLDRKRQPRSGDIVAAYVDSAWTLKYFEKNQDGIRLIAANPTYSPIIPHQSLEIGGVVVSVVRKYY